jgi:hypothetical protein
MLREPRLDRSLELDDAAANSGIDLVRKHGVVEELEPAGDEPVAVGHVAGLAHRGKPACVAEEIRSCELGLDPATLGLLARRDVGVPPRVVGRDCERAEAGLDLLGDSSSAAVLSSVRQ